ncbi:hypothetical protein J6590_055663 [Homalodisca vitripennis]|nr:hypothetical protein J6590_055663 [Homalodisca vitripennis]
MQQHAAAAFRCGNGREEFPPEVVVCGRPDYGRGGEVWRGLSRSHSWLRRELPWCEQCCGAMVTIAVVCLRCPHVVASTRDEGGVPLCLRSHTSTGLGLETYTSVHVCSR